MTQSCRLWLPDQAFDIGSIERDLSEVVSNWGAQWFPDVVVCFSRSDTNARPQPQPGNDPIRVFCEGGALAISEKSQGWIAEEILGVDFGRLEARTTEKDAIDQVFGDCITDLCNCLSKLLVARETDASAVFEPADDDFVGSVEDVGGRKFGKVLISRDLLLRRYLQSLPETGGGREVESRWPSIQQAMVSAGVHLGSCQISLADTKELQVGDVVGLDKSLNDRLDLTIDGAVASNKSVILEKSDGEFSAILKY